MWRPVGVVQKCRPDDRVQSKEPSPLGLSLPQCGATPLQEGRGMLDGLVGIETMQVSASQASHDGSCSGSQRQVANFEEPLISV